ncbi:DUF2474 domain-containing protein [Sandarakinorhabdus rubra]|nr:DUF2474 domain-containing protein [Sandarakinorhabdus rubra]
MPNSGPEPSRARRLAWFVALWGAGVAVVGTVGLILRTWLLG